MIEEFDIDQLPASIHYFFNNWKYWFKYRMSKLVLKSLNWEGEDKNLKAFNSVEEFINWFCYHPETPEPYRDYGFYVRELTSLSHFINPSVIIELGTSYGIGMVMLSNLNPKANLYTVDIKEKIKFFGNKIVPIGYLSKLNNIKCEYIRGKSYEFVPPENFDLCFIDGDHTEEGVWKDSLWAWENKNKDYVIIWHDYHLNHPDFIGLINSIKRFSKYIGKDVYKLKDSSTVWMTNKF